MLFEIRNTDEIIDENMLMKRYRKYDKKQHRPIQYTKEVLMQTGGFSEKVAEKIARKTSVRPWRDYKKDGFLKQPAKEMSPDNSIREYLKSYSKSTTFNLNYKSIKVLEKGACRYKQKAQRKQILNLLKNVKILTKDDNDENNERPKNGITYEKIQPNNLKDMWVLDKDWVLGKRRDIYTGETIAKLSAYKIFQPTRASFGPGPNIHLYRRRYPSRYCDSNILASIRDEQIERFDNLSPESRRRFPIWEYERVYPDPSTKWRLRYPQTGETPIYGLIESPYTRIPDQTPVKLSEIYNKKVYKIYNKILNKNIYEKIGGYNGKFNLLVNMMKNEKKTISKIASFYE